jgi:hypothetical protein
MAEVLGVGCIYSIPVPTWNSVFSELCAGATLRRVRGTKQDQLCDLALFTRPKEGRLRVPPFRAVAHKELRLLSFIYLVVRSVLRLVVWSLRSRDTQALEVMVLRHQLEVLNRQVGRARFEPHDRLLLAAVSRLVSRARWHVFSVRPETLLRWHHRLVTRRAAWWESKSRGRPLSQRTSRT